MTPDLPKNPMTISSAPRPCCSEEEVWAKFGGRLRDFRFYAEVRAELSQLRAYDTYFRTTSPAREAAKSALRLILSMAHKYVEPTDQDPQRTLRGVQGVN